MPIAIVTAATTTTRAMAAPILSVEPGMGYTVLILDFVVIVTDTDHWAGFRPDRIKNLTHNAA